ncbi:condensation domain-containing protein [Streptomyces sp. NPDC045470]|uniref:condensation domain-containing protein n=1 Tax=Streptomyces sp. NPDC045470 TaxID=3155469 RepID=UPI0033C428EC
MHSTSVRGFLKVPFEGTRSGEFPLTWGQRWVWNSVSTRAPYYADLGGSYVVAVPDECDLTTVSGAINGILNRYETFRSRYSIAADESIRQTVVARGHLRVEVLEADAVDARSAASAAENEFNNLPFTLPELALRAAVIVTDGVPRFVVLCAFHMAMDCHGMVAVLDDFRVLLGGKTINSGPPEVAHPADRALAEQSPQGVQRSIRGVQFWERELAKFPEDPLPYTGRGPESPRYQTFALRSQAVRAVSLALAEELGVSMTSVILAMAASLLGRRCGSGMCGIVLAASHRYEAESMRYPGTLVQGVPVALDVSEDATEKLISRCHRGQMLAALAGHCHPDDLAAMLRERYSAEAVEAALACVVNLNLPTADDSTAAGGTRITRAEAERLTGQSRCEFLEGTPVENERFYLAMQGDASDFSLTLRADTAVLAPAEIVKFLRDLERSVINCLPCPIAR